MPKAKSELSLVMLPGRGKGVARSHARFLLPAPLILGHGELKEPVAGGVLSGVRARDRWLGLVDIGPLKWDQLR